MNSFCLVSSCLPITGLLCCLAACDRDSVGKAQRDPAPNGMYTSSQSARVALVDEKEARTPVQRKLDSHLVLALKRSRHEAPFDRPNPPDPDLAFEADGSVWVDIDAVVTPGLLLQIEAAGGRVASSFPVARAIRARVPLARLETLAASAEVAFITPATQAAANAPINPAGNASP